MSAPASCSVTDCSRKVYKAGYCAGHCRRKYEGRPLIPLRPAQGGRLAAKEPYERLAEASISLTEASSDYAEADSESDDAFERARMNLQDAALWFTLGIPKTPAMSRVAYHLIAELRARVRAERGELANVLPFPFPRPSPLGPSVLAG